MLKSVFNFFLVTLGIALVTYITDFVTAGKFTIDNFWLIFVFIAGITMIAYVLALYGILNSSEMGVYTIMGSVVVKLIFCMGFSLVYLLRFKTVNGTLFLLDFFYLYFLFTVFEIYSLLCNLRHQNKT